MGKPMFRVLKIAAIACAAVLSAMTEAQAGIPIPIPCSGEKIIKVADMPKAAMSDGTKVDLGYMFQYCFGGKWVGYIGSDRSYLNLPDEMLATMAILAGLQELPPAPSFWGAAWHNKWQFFPEWLWLIMVTAIGGGLISNKWRYGTWAHPRSYVAVAAGEAEAARHAAAVPSVSVAPRGFGKRI
jgi:hypothetical protein